MKIGIFGGSFNPAHIGHFEIARSILSLNKIQKLIVVPNYTNPLKSNTPILPNDLRWEILHETFKNLNEVEISDFETRKFFY